MKTRKSKISTKLKKIIKVREKIVKEQKNNIKKTTKKKKSGWIKKIFLLLLMISFLSIGGFLIWASQLKIPNIQELENLKMSQATKIYDRTGKIVLYNIYEDEKRTVVPLSQISKYLQWASVAIEDKNFYEHDGTELYHVIGGLFDNIFHGKRLRGGSTITQQVVKQTVLTRERSVSRKVKEWILSWRLESLKEEEFKSKKKAKDSILEIYLNENPYGGTIYGVEEASKFYFGKHASEVSIAEAAYLASMPQAPTTYSPYGKHKSVLDRRKNAVLFEMLNQGYINIDEYKDAKETDVKFVFQKRNSGIKAPHFVMYVKKQLEGMFDSETLKAGGLKVYTTLNYDLQEKVQEIVKINIDEAEKEKLNVSNGAVTILNPATGEILTMVGSKDYFAKDIDGKFNVTIAKRQPGSTFKTFAYLTAFQKGYTPKTVLWDVKTEFSDSCDIDIEEKILSKNCYRPNNFDFKFKGHILMEQALPESRNIPAIKTLYLAGLNDTFKNIKLMGIDSLTQKANHYGLSLVLGAGEVKLLNLTSAYGVLSNKGTKVSQRTILRIENTDGEEIYKSKIEGENIISKRIALIISRILSDNTLKYPTFGWNSPLYFRDRQVASKTGTTNDDKDFWVVGYDPGNIAVGVWVGNNNNKPGKGHAGHYTKKIWKESMLEALKDIPKSDFEKVEEDYSDKKPVLRGVWQGNTVLRVDTQTNGIATEDTPDEFIKEIPFPEYHSILHWVDKNAPNDPTPEKKDISYERWESGLQYWIREHSDIMIASFSSDLQELLSITDMDSITETDGDNTSSNSDESDSPKDDPNKVESKFKILSPGNGDTFGEEDSLYLKLYIPKKSKIKKFEIYINNKFIASIKNKINIDLSKINGIKKNNKLKIVAVDFYGNRTAKEVNFNAI